MQPEHWSTLESVGIKLFRAGNLERAGLVRHAVSARIGGVSTSVYSSLNLGLHVGDDSSNVLSNRRALAVAAGIDPLAFTCAEQVHGDGVAVIDASQTGAGAMRAEECVSGADALITDVRGPVLTLFFADCVPILILDPVNRAIGLAHAGWKGTSLGIAAKTVEAMGQFYATDPGTCLAAIGPSIGSCCYEVAEDVANAIQTAAGSCSVLLRTSRNRIYADLKAANSLILQRAGIPTDSIAVSNHCTCCHAASFFSYRRDGRTGRMAALLQLR